MKKLISNRDYLGWAVLITAIVLLVFFFIAKSQLFAKLTYQSDLFSHIQSSRSWLQERPIMYENNYGHHARYHNYFFNLLMGPLVLWWGAYGIFIFQLGLYIAALLYAFPYIYNYAQTNFHKIVTGILCIVFFCGPYAYWLYDDPWFGFHTEMLYIPLGLIFSIALLKQNKWLAIVFAVLIISVKEDGVVLLASLHLLHLFVQKTLGHINPKKWIIQTFSYGAIYLLVFAAGIIYLKYQNNFELSRLDKTFSRAKEFSPSEIKNYVVSVLYSVGLLLLPFVLFIGFTRPRSGYFLLYALLLLLPIVAVNFVSGLYYLPHKDFSLTWVPRFSLVFVFLFVVCIYSVLFFSQTWFTKKRAIVFSSIGIGFLLFISQVYILKKEKKYYVYKNTLGIIFQEHPENNQAYLLQIKNLAKVLPYDYPVAPPYWLFAYFHKHDFLWISSAYNAWQQPRMVIVDETKWPEVNPIERLQQPDSVITPKVSYYFEKQDRHYLIEANIIAK